MSTRCRGAVHTAAAALLFTVLTLTPVPAAAAPALVWTDCGDGFQCATAPVPLDYDEQAGPTIRLALIRRPATGPGRRIGTLFTNFGGPGNSGVDRLRTDIGVYPPQVLARFDVVGFDPRGVGQSAPVRCFANPTEQQAFLSTLPAFPVGGTEETRFMAAQAELGRRCHARNGDLLNHLSTANVARDLDRLRRAVGDDKLTYVGHSYGGLLAATYVNLFPDRVRAAVLDSALDPVAWTTGRTGRDRHLPVSQRVDSHRATSAALEHFLRTCDAAGDRCAFSAGDPAAEFDRVMTKLRQIGAVEVDLPQGPTVITYAFVIDALRGGLGFPPGWPFMAASLDALRTALDDPAATRAAGPAPPSAAADSGYDNGTEAMRAILCGETDNPRRPDRWPSYARQADRQAPYFGAAWTYLAAACATWPAFDRDRYTGPWNRGHTPVLVVSTMVDATSTRENTDRLVRTLGSARLLTVEGAGHTIEVVDSVCVKAAMADYLVALRLPANGATCRQDSEPFGTG